MIKKIENNLDNVFTFIKDVYYKTEAKNDTLIGNKQFETEYLCDYPNSNYYGYFDNERLIGVISYKNDGYIKHLFVDYNYLHLGIGSELLNYVINILNVDRIYLESSIYAHDFYLSHGFVDKSDIISENGMSYILMEKSINRLN